MNNATMAATRFTTDSAASDSSPTDPVSSHAPDFRPIVTIAAAIDIHAYRVRLGREFTGIFSQHAGPRSNRPSARDAAAYDTAASAAGETVRARRMAATENSAPRSVQAISANTPPVTPGPPLTTARTASYPGDNGDSGRIASSQPGTVLVSAVASVITANATPTTRPAPFAHAASAWLTATNATPASTSSTVSSSQRYAGSLTNACPTAETSKACTRTMARPGRSASTTRAAVALLDRASRRRTAGSTVYVANAPAHSARIINRAAREAPGCKRPSRLDTDIGEATTFDSCVRSVVE